MSKDKKVAEAQGLSSTDKEELVGVGLFYALCIAAQQGNTAKAEYWVDRGADVAGADYDKRTPLHIAAADGHIKLVKFLVRKGANVNAEDRFGGTPMSDAIRGRHYDIMNYLQGKGGERPDAEVDSLVTKLLTAAAAGDMRKVTEALDDGANANSADYDKRTPMHVAASEGKLEVL
jgi:ankyrin repeat protein